MIAGTARTPIGIFDGKFKDITEQKLGALAMENAINNAGIDPNEIDKIVIGTAKQTSMPSNCARHAMLVAKLPVEVPAYTVHRQSASGMQAIANGFWDIKSDDAQIILAGGTESMSLIPMEIHDARFSFNENTRIIFDPITAQLSGAQPVDKYGEVTIEKINENLERIYDISKEDIQGYAQDSVNKANEYKSEEYVFPIEIKMRKTTETVSTDEGYSDANIVAKPADAAAATILVSEKKAKECSLNILGEILAIGISAGDPSSTGLLGVGSIKSALKKSGLSIKDMDIIEINEISASQSIATCIELKNMGLTEEEIQERVNPNGGCIATGNPWGATGAVLLNKLISELKEANKQYGLIVTPAEGGQAMTMVVKRGGVK